MSSTSSRRLLKEYGALQKECVVSSSSSASSMHGVSISPVSQEDLFHWTGSIAGIPDGPYEDGVWKIDIRIPTTYPLHPPDIKFITPICHPNIHFKTGEVCLDILKNQWTAAWTLLSACIAVRALLTDPEINSPLNIDAANILRYGDKMGYDSLVRYFTNKYAALDHSALDR
ncbi:ubiquitin-conjugating enzyme/RWD-like protein [Lipomyces tetrasporus]|uniref:Ubiquitin-conjugating enzyme/RWD-like protein n=1 Tax=Lipomyces tetrasporus TaxID=54092 RepID=A0AAD7QS74_9ASCO|nr:ubiquitin-conjugating enzyme/RWD-like protein [Lipomyces tetrasporus]KAJ8100549.1 ubiquitin-conjugating enzyme/RWD-like protein [Lipomyces tetrasporus]